MFEEVKWPKSYVYFARGQHSTLIKIGKSARPIERMAELETTYKEPVKVIFVIGGSYRAENEYHRRFRQYRERGEWFRDEGELTKFLAEGMKSDLYRKLQAHDTKERLERVELERLEKLKPPSKLSKPGPQTLGYARVSTQEQVMDVQLVALKEAECDYIFAEKISAVNASRPQFNLMMKHVESGDTIVVYAFSRLSRSVKQLLTIVDDMKKQGVTIRSISEPHIEPHCSTGRMMLSMIGTMDEHERNRAKERTKAAMQQKKADGMYLGRPRLIDHSDIKEMKKLRKAKTPAAEIAKKFGIAISTVYANT